MIKVRTLLLTACLFSMTFGHNAFARSPYGAPGHAPVAKEAVSMAPNGAAPHMSYQDTDGALGHRFAVMVSRHANQRDALKRHKDYLKQHSFLLSHRGAIVRDRFGLWHVIYGAFQSHAEARQACMALEQEKCLVQKF